MTEIETNETEITFEAVRLPRLREEMAKLAKVAKKLGVEPMEMVVGRRETVDQRDERTGVVYPVEMVTVVISGTAPVLPGGWSFVGAIEHLEAGNLIHGDDPVLAGYRSADPNCDHCGMRRNRRKTVILRREDGAVAQVGSACLKDFLGYHGNPERVVRFAKEIRDMVEEMEMPSSGGYLLGVPTTVFLAATAATVRAHGWVPKSFESGFPTASLVALVLGLHRIDSNDKETKKMVDAVEIEARDEEEAAAIRSWALAIPEDTNNNYLGNVRISLLGDFIEARHFGIAASAVSARRKEIEKDEAKAVAAGEAKASEFVGTVGKREVFKVEVTFVRAIEGDYGTTYLVEMKDADGNILKTFASGSFGYSASKGDRVVIKATVKDHEVYNERKATMVSRVAFVEDWTE